MHVVHLSCYVDPRGRAPDVLLDTWVTLLEVARSVRGAGVTVTVVQAAAVDATLKRDGVSVHFVRERSGRRRTRALGLWATPLPQRVPGVVADLAPDVIHFHSLSLPRHVRVLTEALPNVPMLVQDHADRPLPGWRGRVQRRGLGGVAGVAFTASDQAIPFVESGILRGDVPVYEVLESSSHFRPGDQAAAREETGLHGDPILLWVGHLDDNKDPLTVFEAVERVRSPLPSVQLWCCFISAPNKSAVHAWLAAHPRVAPHVHLLGRRPHSEMEGLYRAADFLVSGSHREGSGYAVLEALACGTPALVTDIPSFRRMTGGGTAGAVSAPGDAEAMARSIIEWYGRPPADRRAAVRRHFDRHLSFEVIGTALRSAYERMVSAA